MNTKIKFMNFENPMNNNFNPENQMDGNEETNSEKNQEELSVFEITEKIKNKEKLNEEESGFLDARIEEIKNKVEEWKSEGKNEDEIWKMLSEEERGLRREFDEAVKEQILEGKSKIREEIDNTPEAKEFNGLNEEEKKERVEKRREEIKNDLTREGIEVKDDIEEFRKRREELEEWKKEKFEGYAQMKEELSRICESDLLEGESKEELKKIVGAFRDISQTQLNLERFEYLERSLEDIDSLVDIHNEKDLIIRKLEEVIEKWEELLKLLEKDLEELTEEEELVLKNWAQWIKDHQKELAVAGITIAGGAGTLYALSTMAGGGGGMAVLWNASVAGGGKLVGGALYWGGKTVAGAASFLKIAAVLGWLSQIKEEDVDDFMSKICGVSIPHRKKTATATK